MTVLFMLGLFFLVQVKPRLPAEPVAEKGMEIRLFERAPPEPPRPEPVKPVRQEKSQSRAEPAPPRPAQPTPAAAPTGSLPHQAINSTMPSPVPAAPATSPAAPSQAHPVVRGDDGYVARVRAYVMSRKRYPTGREVSLSRPVGTVRAWLTLDRHGNVQEVGIERSGDSSILDTEALKLLRSGAYPAFPDDAFPGEGSHRFYFDLEYKRGGDQ